MAPYLGGTAPPVTLTETITTNTTTVQAVQPVASVDGINAKTVAATVVYTVPAGKTFVPTDALIRCTAASGITNGPTLGIGVAVGEDDIFASTYIGALTTTAKVFGFQSQGMLVSVPAGSVIRLGIDTASTGTSQTIACDLMGYLL